jgi:hypothetical protein
MVRRFPPHAQPIRQFPGSTQSDGRAAAFRKALNISKDIGGCAINGQRCWKFGGFGHNRVMAAAALQHMHRVFIRSLGCEGIVSKRLGSP